MTKSIKQIRILLSLFILALFLSGLTAIPLETELEFIAGTLSQGSGITNWINKVYAAIAQTNNNFPFLSYGYDWLAFAHFVLAILFIGPLRDPIRNKWVIEFGMIACVLIIPFALVAGHFRQIPMGWRLI